MLKIEKGHPSEQLRRIQQTLAEAVAEALDRKRRLGQYAILYENNQPVILRPDGSKCPVPPAAVDDDVLFESLLKGDTASGAE